MKIEKFRGFVLTLALSLTSTLALAAPVTYWDDPNICGNYIPVYDNGVIEISSPEQLGGYAYKLTQIGNAVEKEQWRSAKLVLTADLNMTGHLWRPIDQNIDGDWMGSIDGQGHWIKNMVCCDGTGDFRGLIDSYGGKGTIENITFDYCESTETGQRNSIIIGGMARNSEVTFKNITFNNCIIGNAFFAGMLVGWADNGAKITATDITASGCKTRNIKERSGCLLGYICSAQLTMDNVTMKNCSIKASGPGYNSIIIGQIDGASTTTLTNISVDSSCSLSGGNNIGGIVGELKGQATIKNCISAVKMEQFGDLTGGLIGNTWENYTNVIIDNCVVLAPFGNFFKTEGAYCNRVQGGVIGLVGNNSAATITHTAVLLGTWNSFYDSTKQGVFVGFNYWGNCGRGSVTITDCATDYYVTNNNIDLASFENSQDWNNMLSSQRNLAIGTGCNGDPVHYNPNNTTVYPVASNDWSVTTHNHGPYYTAILNEKGCRFGFQEPNKDGHYFTCLRPLKDDENGLVARYRFANSDQKNPKQAVLSVHTDALDSAHCTLNARGEYIAQLGYPLYCKYQDLNTEWIVRDLSTGMVANSLKRTGKREFQATADPASTDARTLKCHAVYNLPSVSLQKPEYNSDTQQVTLGWKVNCPLDTLKEYWKTGTWVLYRQKQGESTWTQIGDSRNVLTAGDFLQFTDASPLIDEQATYKLELICPDLFYGKGDLIGTTSASITASGNFSMDAVCQTQDGGYKISTALPYSRNFDKSKIILYKWDQQVDDSIRIAYKQAHSGTAITYDELHRQIIAAGDTYKKETKTYDFVQGQTMTKYAVEFIDKSTYQPCSMNHYIIVSTDFQDGPYKDKTIISSEATFTPEQKVTISSFTASKGESTTKVKIDWTVSTKENGTNIHYSIWRKLYSRNEAGKDIDLDEKGWNIIKELTSVSSTNTIDDEVLPGYVYKYVLRAYPPCDNSFSKNVYEQAYTIGYAASRGTIMGSIKYNSGSTSVAGVDVRLSPDSTSMTNKNCPAYSCLFNEKDSLLLATGLTATEWAGDWTLQFLMKPVSNKEVKRQLLIIPGYGSVSILDDKLYLTVAETESEGMSIKTYRYNYLLLKHESNGTLSLGYAQNAVDNDSYANYPISISGSATNSVPSGIIFGTSINSGLSTLNSFYGYIDEVRLWKGVLSDDEVMRTYNRYLSGNETNLLAYYNFDSGVVEYAFDSSHPNGVWNYRHGSMTWSPSTNTGTGNDVTPFRPQVTDQDVPQDSILCYRGITDANGWYQIAGVPYTGEGTNYLVAPVYGVHEFSPAFTRCYVSGQSLTFSGVDFNDVSSFPVRILVNYAYGNYPEEGAYVLIDGLPAKKNNIRVTTDANGECTVDVPIGQHRLTVMGKSAKQTFVNNGYPCSITNIDVNGNIQYTPAQDKDSLINFQSTPTAAYTFYDKTLYRFAGRVVGGDNESLKSLGGNLSKANIGRVELTVKPTKTTPYKLNGTNHDIVFGKALPGDTIYKDSVDSKTTYLNGNDGSVIKIRTDSLTGEFLAWLPPIKMTVTDCKTIGTAKGVTPLTREDFRLDQTPQEISYNLDFPSADTLRTTASAARIYRYNARKIYTYYENPKIDLYNPLNENGSYPKMLGDSIFVSSYTDSIGNAAKDTINLWNPNVRDGSEASYTVNKLPIFTSGHKYQFNIKLYEGYTNRDSGKDTTYVMKGVELHITNKLSTKSATIKKTGVSDTNDASAYTYSLDSTSVAVDSLATPDDGIVKYEWFAGIPNPVDQYTLGFSLKYNTNGKAYTYPPTGSKQSTIEGIVIGAVRVPGTSVVTAGPDIVSFVLRDPPGSGSSSFISQGSTSSSNYSWDESAVLGLNNDNFTSVESGTWSFVGAAEGTPGLMSIHLMTGDKSKVTNKNHIGEDVSTTNGGGGSTKISYTATERIATSSSSSFVGSSADLYIGCSTNFSFSKSKNLGFVKVKGGNIPGKHNRYVFKLVDGTSIGSSFATSFAYSQKHIVSELIPELRRLRLSLVEIVDNVPDKGTRATGNKSRYYARKGIEKKKDNWIEGQDYVWLRPGVDNVNAVDTIMSLTQSILNWERVIARNEYTKYHTPTDCGTNHYTYEDSGATGKWPAKVEWGYMGNTSLDAGANKTYSIQRSYSTDKNFHSGQSAKITQKHEYSHHFQTFLAGSTIQGTFTTSVNNSTKFTYGGGETETQTFGYTLADGNAGAFFSVDTYLPQQPKEVGKMTDLDSGNSVPSLGEFFVFRLRGGQSKCPWQDVEYTKYLRKDNGVWNYDKADWAKEFFDGDTVKIGDGTVAIEDPHLSFDRPVYTDVPNGQALLVQVTISNKSNAIVKVAPSFSLRIQADSNPYGAIATIDDVNVSSKDAYNIYLMPGESVRKTMTIRQGNTRVLDYKLKFLLVSDCEYMRNAIDSLEIHFKPVSSPVTAKVSSTVINKKNVQDGLPFTISGFDTSYLNFKGINLQYQKSGDPEQLWNTCYTFVANSSDPYWENKLETGKWAELDKAKQSNTVNINMKDYNDGKFLFRAQSFALNGNEIISAYSDTITITKDTVAPTVLLKPTNYYYGDNDIVLTFSEPLDKDMLANTCFSVSGVLNEAEVTHSSGLHFDGSTPAKTNSRVNIFGNDATVGFWYKPQLGKTSCLFSQTIKGSDGKDIPVAVLYNADATMSIVVDTTIYPSQQHAWVKGTQTPIDDWMYAALVINNKTDTLTLYNLFGTSDGDQSRFIICPMNKIIREANVPLYIGGSNVNVNVNADSKLSALYSQLSACHADMESFVIYDGVKMIADIAANKSNRHSQNTRGLLAYWPMDEGDGTTARDVVRLRNLTLQGTDNWYLPVDNYALNLNGKQYLMINTKMCSISKDEDYVLEMNFRAKKSMSTSTIFSNGWGGENSKEQSLSERLSISLDSNGGLLVAANGMEAKLGGQYNDDQWHNLALNVHRDGYITVLVDTIDVSGNISVPGSVIGGLANGFMTLGAMRYQDADSFVVKNYMNGQIDEVRLWNAYKTDATVKSGAYYRLTGDEAGLVAYYPFEYTGTVAQQPKTFATLSDRCAATLKRDAVTRGNLYPYWGGVEVADTTKLTKDVCLANGPRLHAADYISKVDITWKASTNSDGGVDGVVLSFPATLPKSRIEGCMLNFTVLDAADLYGNHMEQPYTWNVYVRQNGLMWYAEQNSLVQDIGTSIATKITIANISSSIQTWNITDLPTWASVSKTTGTLSPYESESITLTTVDGTAVGNYQGLMYLYGSDEIYEPLAMSLAVTCKRPDWTVEQTTGATWMTVFGRLKINDTWTTNENDIVGMFEGDRCLALASPQYSKEMDKYFLYLNIKGNKDDAGKKLQFRIWDSTTGVVYNGAKVNYWKGKTEYNDTCQVFTNCAVLGDFTRPYVISATDIISQTLALHEGWNLISLWVRPDVGYTADKVFAPVVNSVSELKTSTGGLYPKDFARLKLTPTNSYRIFLNKAATLSIDGQKVNPDTVQMIFRHPLNMEKTSWQWMGFPLWKMMTLSEAFADFKPVTNDIVKGEDAYAMYNGNTWIGNLKYLTPGMGYLYGYHYDNAQDATWHYPSNAKSASALTSNGFSLGVDKTDYEDYTFVDVSVVDDKGNLINGFDYQLAAFISTLGEPEGACRGVADGLSGESCPISIFGDEGETYTFKLYNKANGQVYELYGTKEYDNLTSPQTLTLYLSPTGINNINADADDNSGDRYNISGAKVDNTTRQQGVYINNGRKEVTTKSK